MAIGGPVPEDEPAHRKNRLTTGVETGEFLLHLSHDLRASLRAIRVNAEMLVRELKATETASCAQHLNVIVSDTARIESLANGLANYAIACQITQDSFVVISVETLVRKVVARLAQELRDNSGAVTYGALPRIRCEPDRIGNLFENLIRNALVHRHSAAPRVHIAAEGQGNGWLFSVRDNGPGIESGYLERVFEPFERLRGQQAAGPGLGLAICGEIVERHGGRIWAESEPGHGATFFFTLPGEP
jgi:signal transduction histidine kinase